VATDKTTDKTTIEAQRRFGRTVLLLVILGFAGVLIAGLTAVAVMLRGQEETRWVDHTYQVERQVGMIRLSLEEMRSARRGVALNLANDSGATYPDASSRFFKAIEEVGRLTIDNPVQQRRLSQIRVLGHKLDGLFIASMLSGTSITPQAEAERQDAARSVQQLSDQMLAAERLLMTTRSEAQRRGIATFYIVLAVTGALLIGVAAGSIWIIRRYTEDLRASQDALRELNGNLEGAVLERTTDLQRANEEIQRFAYIVSHDLRSPLVNVMGFTAELDAATKPLSALIDKIEESAPDLLTEAARLAVREDLPESVNFIRSSTQKMDRLINAILRLSREGRRTITPERLDLTALSTSVVDTLRHRIDELGVDVRIAPNMPAIVSDRLALEQIVANLVENAVKYLKPGRPGLVEIGATLVRNRILISIADNGRGIEPRDHERIFDLFRRSGAQDQPGEGIGLAHVRALAYRLGGTIGVESEFEKGATFKVNLPAEYAGERGAAA